MKINFDPKTAQIIDNLAQFAKDFGVKIYFVGGLVRDVLMGLEPLDIDILVESNAIDFALNCPFVEVKSLHQDFCTAKTVVEGLDIDFASTRVEIYPKSGCLPVVTKIGCPVKEDLIRRDFSVNAIAAEILGGGEYEIIDIFNGQKDIKTKTLRVLHEKSFIDDPTRILRGLDFKLRFGFEFDFYTQTLAAEALKNPDRSGLSRDRVILTLKKLFSNEKLAKIAFDEFCAKKYYKILDDKEPDRAAIENAIKIFSPETAGEIYFEALKAKNVENEAQTPLCTMVDIYKYYKNFTPKELCVEYIKTENPAIVDYFKNYRHIKVYTKGADILDIGFKQGKIIGEILENVLNYKILHPDELKNKQDEISYIKKTFIL